MFCVVLPILYVGIICRNLNTLCFHVILKGLPGASREQGIFCNGNIGTKQKSERIRGEQNRGEFTVYLKIWCVTTSTCLIFNHDIEHSEYFLVRNRHTLTVEDFKELHIR